MMQSNEGIDHLVALLVGDHPQHRILYVGFIEEVQSMCET